MTTADSVWVSFTEMLKAGLLDSNRIHPYHPALLEPLQTTLDHFREGADWQEWSALPEIHCVGNQIHYLIHLTLNQSRELYCFSFSIEGEAWYFQHVECITLRLDALDPLPTGHFPDLPETQKAWIREEVRITEKIRLFNWLVAEKGRAAALDWFLDGAGYALMARSWVPFGPAHRAFILFMCWEQANLYGSPVCLIELSDTTARVQIEPLDFKLYAQTAHLKLQISFGEYRCLFETLWRDRALKAGWQVDFEYQKEIYLLSFHVL